MQDCLAQEFGGQDELFDSHQDIARSAFADMLHDTERNQKYYRAIRITIDKLHSQGVKANVLDIGTGSGLLSLMAISCGADSVVACEGFLPMANCAEKIFKANGMSTKVKLIKKRSNQLKVGAGLDMETKANVLVAELLDTELIGEGAIATYIHAHKHLLEKDCIVIPTAATVYAQIAECPLALSWQTPKSIANADGEILLRTPRQILDCAGSNTVHDIQLSQLSRQNFKILSDPIPVFNFDWSGKTELILERKNVLKVKATNNGIVQVLFMWWDIQMDVDDTIRLSCAPFWAHPDFEELRSKNKSLRIQNVIPWRDHWMQAVYFPGKNGFHCQIDDEIVLASYHDEYEFWFNFNDTALRPYCTCRYHQIHSRTRIGQINDSLRNKKYLNYFENILGKNDTVLVLSSGSLLGLAITKIGVKKVYLLEKNKFSRECMQSYKEFNEIENAEIIPDFSEIKNLQEVTHVIGEPFFSESILPWDNLEFIKLVNEIRGKLNENVQIVPSSATLYMIPVEFIDLHKIHAPVGTCEGFDVSIMDSLVENSSDLTDEAIDAQPLWEYPSYCRGNAVECLKIDFDRMIEKNENLGAIQLKSNTNALAFWMDWHLDKNVTAKTTVTTGYIMPPSEGDLICWYMHNRQGVHFLKENHDATLKFNVKFNSFKNEIKFSFC